jgi:5-methylcytosine-specific restriction enzyme A
MVCEREGRVTPTAAVHHIVPVSEGGAVFVGDESLVAVCRTCHVKIEKLGRDWTVGGIGVGKSPA